MVYIFDKFWDRFKDYLRAIYLSFYSPRLYISVAKIWRGCGFLYINLIVAILCLPFVLQFSFKMNSFYDTQLIPNIKKMPELNIKNGIISLDKSMPYIINNHKNEPVIYIDTTGNTRDFKKLPHTVFMLITNNNLQFSGIYGDKQTMSLPKDIDGNINSLSLIEILINVKYLVWLSIFPLTLSFIVAIHYSSLMFFSLVGILYSKVYIKLPLNYFKILRVCSVASTPELFVMFFLFYFNSLGSKTGLILFFIMFMYFHFALKSIKSSSKSLVA